jgi:hypothetical protein
MRPISSIIIFLMLLYAGYTMATSPSVGVGELICQSSDKVAGGKRANKKDKGKESTSDQSSG